MKLLLLAFTISATSFAAQAGDVYGGIGFPGVTLGYAQPINETIGVRGEFSGGLSTSKNGSRDGIDYTGNLKAQSIGGFVDWFPTSTAFRLTGGLTFNDTKFNLNSTGASNTSATINGKSVNLAGEQFNVNVSYPNTTPYLGLGYGFKPNSGKGLGFYADLGVTIGKFKTNTTTTIVGKQGITQADVNAQTQKLRDDLNKLSVLPKFSVGVSYSF